jgi:hypothetical protein
VGRRTERGEALEEQVGMELDEVVGEEDEKGMVRA